MGQQADPKIITEVEQLWRWSAEEKLRIVAETLAAAAWFRHLPRLSGGTRSGGGLLWNWRSQVRRRVLMPEPPPAFLPARTISGPANSDNTKYARAILGDRVGCGDARGQGVEITLPDGTSVKVGHDVGLVTLRRACF